MRLIDADALIEFCAERWIPLNIDAVNMQPTIQPEQCSDKSYTLWKESYEELKRRMDELTSCSDIISRQAAIDALDFEIVHMTVYCDGENEGNPLAQYNKGLEDGKKAIEALPPTQPEPNEGYWKKDETDDCPPVFRQFRICSVCGAIETSETNYCPNCGAKMTISTK